MSLVYNPTYRSLTRIRPISIRTLLPSCRALNSEPVRPRQTSRGNVAGFVFDIDGVLKKGEIVFPGARRVLALLKKQSVPFVLCTNGGGIPEHVRCGKLSRELETEILPSQLVQSHSPLRHLIQKYKDEPVLVIGGKDDNGRKVAHSYGLTKAYTPLDILRSLPSIWPFRTLLDSDLPYTILPPTPSSPDARPFSNVPFKAVIVLNDSRDWGLDISIISELLASEGGVLGTSRRKREGELEGDDIKQDVEVFFSNPDLLWGSDYPLPRFGDGAFRTSLLTIHKEATGHDIKYTQLGKPHRTTYDFARRMLDGRRKEMGLGPIEGEEGKEMKGVWMVGDNPASDIAGANLNGLSSLLVRTGVFRDSAGPPAHAPTRIVEDVEEGVMWVLRKEGIIP